MTTANAGPLLSADNVTKTFGGFVALDSVSFEVPRGQRLGLIGPNGSGKSTLVNCLTGRLPYYQGSVRLSGEAIDGLKAHQRCHLGITSSYQLPRPFHSLSVADNLRVPLLFRGKVRALKTPSPHALQERCHELLRMVSLEHLGAKYPRDLTQVEMRKLELARAMASEPKLLIADEAMAGLSEAETRDIVDLLIRLNETGVTVILIEHIMTAVLRFSQRLLVLVSGKTIADGSPRDVIRHPEVVRAYLGQ
jgi:branched-chain amino acid transport system ATP-binding protein